MKCGTKSILFGVHQFIWHPWTVARAWRWLYGRWPTFHQWVAIFCHDIGYFGKSAMDSPEGQTHPEVGAKLARKIVYWSLRLRGRSSFDAGTISDEIHDLCLFHSTHYAQLKGNVVSALYLPDKACVLFDPPRFYLLRGKWSGEIYEYVNNENRKRLNDVDKFRRVESWLFWYRDLIKRKTNTFFESGFRK